jgi:hypothetical protein
MICLYIGLSQISRVNRSILTLNTGWNRFRDRFGCGFLIQRNMIVYDKAIKDSWSFDRLFYSCHCWSQLAVGLAADFGWPVDAARRLQEVRLVCSLNRRDVLLEQQQSVRPLLGLEMPKQLRISTQANVSLSGIACLCQIYFRLNIRAILVGHDSCEQ